MSLLVTSRGTLLPLTLSAKPKIHALRSISVLDSRNFSRSEGDNILRVGTTGDVVPDGFGNGGVEGADSVRIALDLRFEDGTRGGICFDLPSFSDSFVMPIVGDSELSVNAMFDRNFTKASDTTINKRCESRWMMHLSHPRC